MVASYHHCTVAGLPLADAAKVTLFPLVTVWLTGEVTITGGAVTATASSVTSGAGTSAGEVSLKSSVVLVDTAAKFNSNWVHSSEAGTQ